jgi:hypothetical protein
MPFADGLSLHLHVALPFPFAPLFQRAEKVGSRAGPSRAEPAFVLVEISSSAELAHYLNELEPSRAELARYPALSVCLRCGL